MRVIEELMKGSVVTAAPGDPVSDVVRRMADARVGAVVVVEGERLRGIFTERDLVTRVVGAGRDPASTPVAEAASEKIVSVQKDASIRSCAEILKTQGIRHLPVTDGDRPIGIVSARDFFEAVSGQLENVIERIRYDESLKNAEDPYDHFGGSYGR